MVDLQGHRPAAVIALGMDGQGEGCLPELPLHEGRREGVFRSGSVEALAAVEGDGVGRGFRRRHHEIAFVLTILVVNDDEHPTGGYLSNALFYRRERTAHRTHFPPSVNSRSISIDCVPGS